MRLSVVQIPKVQPSGMHKLHTVGKIVWHVGVVGVLFVWILAFSGRAGGRRLLLSG